MKCRNCGFENYEGESRCFRCRSFLGSLAEAELFPPRRKEAPAGGFLFRLGAILRRFQYRRRSSALSAPLEGAAILLPPLASLLVPPSGQLINRKYLKAALFFGGLIFVYLWYYWRFFKTFYLSSEHLLLFLNFLGTAPYGIIFAHGFLVFDAYSDAVWMMERRRIRILESLLVSILITALVVGLITALRQIPGERFSMHGMVRIPNLLPQGLQEGDVLILDRGYYRSHPIRPGQFVSNPSSYLRDVRLGNEPIFGMIPGVVLGLPGDVMRLTPEGIFRNGMRLAPLPAEWRGAVFPIVASVPPKKYFVLPALSPGDFPGMEKLYAGRADLEGRFIMIFTPESRRKMLP